jgi:hypothetical protein
MAVDVQKWFNEDFGAGLGRHAEEVRKTGYTYHVIIVGDGGGEWDVDTRSPKVDRGLAGGCDLTITMDSSTFAKIYDNPSQVMGFFFSGQLKLVGNQETASKFFDLLQLAKQ